MPDPTPAGRAFRAVLLATLTALALAGCSDSGEDDSKPSSSSSSSSSTTASTSPSPSSAATSASPSPTVTAADGSDPGACADGNCEIAITEPVTIRFKIPDGPAKLTLTKVGKDSVGYKVTQGDSKTSGEANGPGSGCVAVFSSGGSRSMCGGAGPAPDAVKDAVVLQVASGEDGTALVRLVS